jgi:hypothetical protein
VAAVTVANDKVRAEQVLNAAEHFAADQLGGALVSSGVEWI